MKKQTKDQMRAILELYLTESKDEIDIAIELGVSSKYVHHIIEAYNDYFMRKYYDFG